MKRSSRPFVLIVLCLTLQVLVACRSEVAPQPQAAAQEDTPASDAAASTVAIESPATATLPPVPEPVTPEPATASPGAETPWTVEIVKVRQRAIVQDGMMIHNPAADSVLQVVGFTLRNSAPTTQTLDLDLTRLQVLDAAGESHLAVAVGYGEPSDRVLMVFPVAGSGTVRTGKEGAFVTLHVALSKEARTVGVELAGATEVPLTLAFEIPATVEPERLVWPDGVEYVLPEVDDSVAAGAVPDVAVPQVTVPQITVPQITVPQITMPKIDVPVVALPTFSVPEFVLPQMALAPVVGAVEAPAVSALEQGRPTTGLLRSTLASGGGELRIANGTDNDGLVIVVGTGDAQDRAASLFVRTADDYRLTGIPDGEYQLYFMKGSGWDAAQERFAVVTTRQKFDDTLLFTTTATQYTVWEVTLYATAGGNAATSEVPPDGFPVVE